MSSESWSLAVLADRAGRVGAGPVGDVGSDLIGLKMLKIIFPPKNT